MSARISTVSLAPDYSIPRIINGAWQLSEDHGPRPPDGARAVDALLALADLGLTAFDCADIYTGVEVLLGEFLRRWRQRGGHRDAIRIHTKFVPDRGDLPRVDRAYVERIIDRSLRRLGVERLDLVQYYWWDYTVPGWLDAAGWLSELCRAGKIRYLGVTNFDTRRLASLLDAGAPIVTNQVQYSLLDRRPENGLVELCRRRGVQLLCYGTLAGGFLTRRWHGLADPGKTPGNRSLVKYRLIVDEFGGWDALQALLDVLQSIAARHDKSMANVATAWAMSRPGVAATILGARSSEHAASNLGAFDLRLDADDLVRLGQLLGRHAGPAGDAFGLERTPGGPHAAIMKTDLSRVGDEGGQP